MKKLISILVVAALLAVCLMSSVFASEDPQIIVDSAVANPGEEVVLNVALVNNPGITNGKIFVEFDETGLEFIEIDVSSAHAAGFLAMTNPDLYVMNFVTTADVDSDFVLFAVKFRVKDGAAGQYKVGLTIDLMANNAGDDVAFTVVEGVVSTHVCDPVPVEGIPATYTSTGVKAHGKCACGKLYIDGVEVTEEDLIIPILREVVVDSATAEPGQEIVLNVSLVNNPGITNGKITVEFDSSGLEFIEIDVSPAQAAGFALALTNPEQFNMNFMTPMGDVSGDFVLFTVKFKVLDNAAEGDYRVGLILNKIVNDDNEDIPFEVVEGTVTVHSCQPGEVVTENVVEATCTTEGSYDEVIYCTICGKELSRETVTVTSPGHDYDATVTEPTCTEQGYTTYTCHCGDSYVDDYVDPKGHEMGQWYVYSPSTGHVKGEKRCDCAHCDYYESQMLPLLGDVNGDDVVDSSDARDIMKYDLGMLSEADLNLEVGDVDGDGAVDSTDARYIMQFDLGIILDFPRFN